MKHFDRKLASRNMIIRKAKLKDANKIHYVLEQAFKGLEGRGYSTQAIQTAIVDVRKSKDGFAWEDMC